MRRLTAGLVAMAAMALLALDAWATGPSQSLPAGQLGKPDDAGQVTAQDEDYRIGPFDLLDVSVFQVDMLTRELKVDATGHIQFPMIGEVIAAGKTARQLGDEIAERLDKSYLRSPQVTAYLMHSANRKFTVEGAVT